MTINEHIYVEKQKLYTSLTIINPQLPTLVFLHDSLGCTKLWRDFPEKLAQLTGCNHFCYDRLGYGLSDALTTFERPIHYLENEADVLAQLLEAKKINNVILFGHSDGASIALLAASKYPHLFKAVISEAAHIFVEKQTLAGIANAHHLYKTTNLPERLAKYHGDKVDYLIQAWVTIWNRPDYQTWNVSKKMKNIICPLLCIQGTCDEYGTLEQVEQIMKYANGPKEKYIIPNIGHTPHKEVPDLVAQRVVEFLALHSQTVF